MLKNIRFRIDIQIIIRIIRFCIHRTEQRNARYTHHPRPPLPRYRCRLEPTNRRQPPVRCPVHRLVADRGLTVLDTTFCQQAETPHLIAAARASMNPLTSTPLETELLNRLEDLQGEHAAVESYDVLSDFDADELEALAYSHDASIVEMTKMMQALKAADIQTLKELNEVLATHSTSIPSA